MAIITTRVAASIVCLFVALRLHSFCYMQKKFYVLKMYDAMLRFFLRIHSKVGSLCIEQATTLDSFSKAVGKKLLQSFNEAMLGLTLVGRQQIRTSPRTYRAQNALEKQIANHGRDIHVSDLLACKTHIEAHGLPCSTHLVKEKGFMSIRIVPAKGFVHLGSEKWRRQHDGYHYHITLGWCRHLSSAETQQLEEEWEHMNGQVAHASIVLTGCFSSPGSCCFNLDARTCSALGPLFSKWAAKADRRGLIHCSM